MKFKKISIFVFSLFVLQLAIFATTASYKGKDYEIRLVYNRDFCAGDPVFVQAQFIFKDDLQNDFELTGKTTLIDKKTDKKLNCASLFRMSENSVKNAIVVTSMIPTSTFLKKSKYALFVEYKFPGLKKAYFSLPLNFKEKEFVSEDIPLNDANSSIRQNNSSTRKAQIDKLNSILATNDYGPYQERDFPQFCEPIDCKRRTSFFGDRRKFIYSNGKTSTTLHYGIDYGVKTGNDVFSCAQGKVVMAENRISTGWSVCIEHLPGLYSLYYHMDSLNVQEGDIIDKGTLLGKSGCTGLATGPHLHWEMRLNMSAVNPDWFVQEFPAIFVQEKETFFRQ